MMQTVAGVSLDEFGYRKFKGSPTDVLPHDLVLEKTMVVMSAKDSNHHGRPATELSLIENGEDVTPAARIVLRNNTQLYFWRQVFQDPEKELVQEPQLFEELIDCEDPYDSLDWDTDEHAGHHEYNQEWRGNFLNVPQGMLVGINLQHEKSPAHCECKFVDSVYPNGSVIFTDGTAYQSHPDYEWIGWVKS